RRVLSQPLDDDLVALGEQTILALPLAQERVDRRLRATLWLHVAAPTVIIPDDAAAWFKHRPHAKTVGHHIIALVAAVNVGEVIAPLLCHQAGECLPRQALDLLDPVAEGCEIAVEALLDPGCLLGLVVTAATERVDAGDGRALEEVREEDCRASLPGADLQDAQRLVAQP